MSRILIRGGQVVSGRDVRSADVLIADGKIVDFDPPSSVAVDEVVDATGLHVLPGIVDPHVHFRQPGLEHKDDFAHATRACAKGGVTSFLEMPNTKPATVTVDLLHQKLDLAS